MNFKERFNEIEENDYEEITDEILAEWRCMEQPEKLLTRWAVGPSRWRGNQ